MVFKVFFFFFCHRTVSGEGILLTENHLLPFGIRLLNAGHTFGIESGFSCKMFIDRIQANQMEMALGRRVK